MENHFLWTSFLNSRQIFGRKYDLSHRNDLSLNLYKCMATRKESIWDSDGHSTSHTGGIFNLEYSPDG